MPISAPPTIPQITDPSTFATRAQEWVVWQANEFYPGITDIAGLSGLPSSATSTTSNTIGTGSKSFTVETGRGFIAGQSLSIAYTTTPTNRMFAVVVSYNSGTGALVVNVQAFEGSGTFEAWSIALAFNGVIGTGQIADDAVTTAKILDANVTQAKLASGVAGNGPAFGVDKTTNQALSSGVVTIVTWQTVLFDTNSNFASNRFTPTVAGYYQINATVRCQATNMTASQVKIHKNGVNYVNGTDNFYSTTSNSINHTVSAVVYCNGTTDYVEIYGSVTGTSPIFQFAAVASNGFSGCLVRAA